MSMFDRFKRSAPAQETAVSRQSLPQRPQNWNASRRGVQAFRGASFEASENSRLFSTWGMSESPINSVLRGELTAMRARSRDMSRNQDYGRRFYGLLKQNVVGADGIRLKMDVRTVAGKKDRQANAIIEKAFNEWARLGNCTVCGRYSLIDVQNLWIETLAKDGESLMREWKGSAGRFGGAFGYGLQFLSTPRLDTAMSKRVSDKVNVVLGVELNEFQRPLGYHFRTTEPNADFVDFRSRATERVPASQILHSFIAEEVGQVRGFPWAHSTLVRLKRLHMYERAEATAADLAARKNGFFFADQGEFGDGLETDEDGNYIVDVEEASFDVLPKGVTDFKPYDPQHPMQQFPDFVSAMLHGVSAGLNISYPALSTDLKGVNYSSIRQGELTDRDHWKAIQKFMIEQLLEPVFRSWLAWTFVTNPEKLAPLPVEKLEKWFAATWRARGYEWVDPLKEVNAQEKAIANGLKSRTQIVAAMGGDIEDVFDDLAEEDKLAAERGLDFSKASNAPTKDQAEPPDDGDEDDETVEADEEVEQ